MSTGLLRGLAARAMGLDAPLRSQRVRGVQGLSVDPTRVIEPGPSAPGAPAVPWQEPVARVSRAGGETDPGMAGAGSSAAGAGARAPGAAAVTRQAAPPAQGPDGPSPPASPWHRDPTRVWAPAPLAAAQAAAVAAPSPEQLASHSAAGAAAPMLPAMPHGFPPALLPLSVPARLPPPAPHGQAPMHRARSSQTAAAEAPTEVHVSIGRVELTALAPTAGTRTPARREAPAGRSLADYLRGPGGKRST